MSNAGNFHPDATAAGGWYSKGNPEIDILSGTDAYNNRYGRAKVSYTTMVAISAAFQISLPPWLLARAEAYAPEPDLPARMAFVVDLAAINIRFGGGPFAAAVFNATNGELLSVGGNQVLASGLAIAHAEIVALSLAQQRLGAYDLAGAGRPVCQLVSSAEPCLMCLGAILWSGVRSLAYAAGDSDIRAIGFDEGPKPMDWVGAFRARGIEVVTGVLRERAKAVLEDYRLRGGILYNAQRT